MKIVITILAALLFSGCSQNPRGAATIEELKARYESAFDSGNSRAIKRMVYWADSPDELKELMESIITSGAGKDRILSVAVIPLSEMEYAENTLRKQVEPTIPLTHWLVVKCDGRKDGENGPYTGEKQIGVGKLDGTFYITGIRYKK